MQSDKGTPLDKLRAALVYLLTCESLPSDSEYEQISTTLQVTSQSLSHNHNGGKEAMISASNSGRYTPMTFAALW